MARGLESTDPHHSTAPVPVRDVDPLIVAWAEMCRRFGWGFVVVDAAALLFQYVSEAYASMHGYDAFELMGKPVPSVYDPERRDDLMQALGEEARAYKTVHLRKDGSRFPAQVVVVPINNDERRLFAACVRDLSEVGRGMDGQGEPLPAHYDEELLQRDQDDGVTLLEGRVRDITAKQRAEEAIQESEERFRHVFELCPIPAAIFRANDLQIVHVNPGFVALLGLEPDQLLGEIGPALDVFVDEHEPATAIERLEREGELHNYEMKMRSMAGRPATVLWSASYVKIGGVRHIVAMANDVTELRRAEAELRQLREAREVKADRAVAGENRYRLTFREFTVLHLLAEGKTDKEIAAELVISPLTVHRHVSNILGKMDAHSRTEAGTRALREGLID